MKTEYRPHSALRRALSCCVALAAAGACLAQTNPLHYFMLGNTQMNMNKADSIAKFFGLTEKLGATGAPLPIWSAADGSVRMFLLNNTLEVIPDLRRAQGTAPTNAVALRLTQGFASQYGLFTDDSSSFGAGEYINWGDEQATPKGHGSPITPFKCVRFQRMLDNLPVYGRNSQLSLECNQNALIGLLFNLRPAAASNLPVVQKNPDQIMAEYNMILVGLLKLNPGSPQLVSKTLCYLDQGSRFIQPAYRFRVLITGPNGDKVGEEIFVPIGKNTPEPVLANRFNGFDPIAAEQSPAPPLDSPTNSVTLGEYVVRNDSDQGICLNIANDFYSNSRFAASATGRYVTRTQYYWDVQWLWMAALGIGDNSPYYPGAVNWATVICHGQPWGFSCLSNYGEWVDMHKMDHYGANYPSGNPSHDYTSYMLLTGCSLMPAPGDGYGGYFTSGSCFDVYWNIFWGMHGMFGYRTTAGKQDCDTSFSNFGYAAGLGCPLVGSWMNATGSLDHSSNWNYGTAVINSGREGDTMYNTEALPAAGSLTMWWNHP